MPPVIISPSVLASDFGQLTAECKRMIIGGAQWLHMGKLPIVQVIPFSFLQDCRCYGWVTYQPSFLKTRSRSNSRIFTVILSPISPWVLIISYRIVCILPSKHTGAPILSCVHKGVPGIFMDCHMMVSQPDKVILRHHLQSCFSHFKFH